MEGNLTLIQKLLEIRKAVGYLQKTERGNQGAMYVDPAILLKKVRDEMNVQGILLFPKINEATIDLVPDATKKDPSATSWLFKSCVTYTWINQDDSSEKMEVPWFITGKHLQDPAMSQGSALTYGERYFLLKFFQIPTAKDDPEYFEQKTKEKEPPKVVTMGPENVSWMISFCKRNKLTNPEKKKEFMKKYKFDPHSTTAEEFSIIKVQIESDYNEV